jgi:ABC-type transporter Mla subunit MlaD
VAQARAAAEAVRNINHLTPVVGGYAWPADVDAVVAWLEALAERLPQTLQQAAGWLDAAERAGRLRDDKGEAPVVVVAAIDAHLDYARTAAEHLRRALHDAHQLTARLGDVAHRRP